MQGDFLENGRDKHRFAHCRVGPRPAPVVGRAHVPVPADAARGHESKALGRPHSQSRTELLCNEMGIKEGFSHLESFSQCTGAIGKHCIKEGQLVFLTTVASGCLLPF